MINVTRRDPTVVGRTVAENKLTWLGRASDGYHYATHNGQEYAVAPHPSNPEDYSRRRDELFVMRVRREVIDGSDFEHHNTHRALPVPTGTYESLVAKEAEREAARTAKPPVRLLDALAGHPLLARRTEEIHPIPSSDRLDVGLVRTGDDKEAAEALLSVDRKPPPSAIRIPGQEPRQGVDGIKDALRSKSVTLHQTKAGTFYWLGPRLLGSVSELIDLAGPLLYADALGQRLPCELTHQGEAPEADHPLVGGAVACYPHIRGELAP